MSSHKGSFSTLPLNKWSAGAFAVKSLSDPLILFQVTDGLSLSRHALGKRQKRSLNRSGEVPEIDLFIWGCLFQSQEVENRHSVYRAKVCLWFQWMSLLRHLDLYHTQHKGELEGLGPVHQFTRQRRATGEHTQYMMHSGLG